MKILIRFFFVFCLSAMLIPASARAANPQAGVVDKIAQAIRNGDADELSKEIGNTVEVALPGNEGIFSKAQAGMILRDFFNKYAPVSFTVNQKGNSTAGSQFLIGTYKSRGQVFNVYVLLKQAEGQLQVQQIHFEND